MCGCDGKEYRQGGNEVLWIIISLVRSRERGGLSVDGGVFG